MHIVAVWDCLLVLTNFGHSLIHQVKFSKHLLSPVLVVTTSAPPYIHPRTAACRAILVTSKQSMHSLASI